MGFTLIPTEWGQATFVGSESGTLRASIVDLIFSNIGRNRHTLTSVVHDDDVRGSDRRLIFTEIQGPSVTLPLTTSEPLLNVKKIHERQGKYKETAALAFREQIESGDPI